MRCKCGVAHAGLMHSGFEWAFNGLPVARVYTQSPHRTYYVGNRVQREYATHRGAYRDTWVAAASACALPRFE